MKYTITYVRAKTIDINMEGFLNLTDQCNCHVLLMDVHIMLEEAFNHNPDFELDARLHFEHGNFYVNIERCKGLECYRGHQYFIEFLQDTKIVLSLHALSKKELLTLIENLMYAVNPNNKRISP